MATAIPTPYRISVPDSKLEHLRDKLAAATFPDELDGPEDWVYGTPLREVRRLAKYWQNEFDWRSVEARLNEDLPQYTTDVKVDGFDSLQIHFVWERSGVQGAIPLLFVHGWPGNFVECAKIIKALPRQDGAHCPAFDVVALSLPNYGFSEGVKKRGFGLTQYAECCNRLMLQLGYNEYVTQGGDWGAWITRSIGILYPQHCKGSHLNMMAAGKPKFTQNPWQALKHTLTPYTDAEKAGLARSEWFNQQGSGYRHEQSTKPQTIGYAFADSPVALLAWIYEKLHDWTDSYPWTDEEICTWISIYWFSAAGPAANARIYFEAFHPSLGDKTITRQMLTTWTPGVKLGFAHFPKELTVLPLTWCRTLGPVVYESKHDRGGHFAAWERPDVIVGDLRNMFGKGGGAYGVVKGKDGYESLTAKL